MVQAKRPAVRPLQTGERMDAEEFERRWNALPDLQHAELIDGEVFVPSPTSNDHGEPHAFLIFLFYTYQLATPGTRTSNTPTIRLTGSNRPQPDAVLMVEPAAGGQSRLSADRFLTGSPELLVEIAVTTAHRDLGIKRDLYDRSGALEYVVWNVSQPAVHLLVRRNDHLVEIAPDTDGIWRSGAFPGFWLDVGALLTGNTQAVLATLQAGLASPEHAAFVRQLAERRAAGG